MCENRIADCLQYLIETKTVSLAEADWTEIFTRWPYLTKGGVNHSVRDYRRRDQVPLYQGIQDAMNSPNFRVKINKKSLERKLELVKELEKLKEKRVQ